MTSRVVSVSRKDKMTVAGALKKESQDPSGPCSNVVDDELQVNQTL